MRSTFCGTYTHVLARRSITLLIDELAIDPHLVDLLQTQGVVPQIRLAQAPPMREDQALELLADLREAIVDGQQRRCDILALVLRLDLLHNLKALLERGGADRLRRGDDAARGEELAVHALAAAGAGEWWGIRRVMGSGSRVNLAQLLRDGLELRLVGALLGGERHEGAP